MLLIGFVVLVGVGIGTATYVLDGGWKRARKLAYIVVGIPTLGVGIYLFIDYQQGRSEHRVVEIVDNVVDTIDLGGVDPVRVSWRSRGCNRNSFNGDEEGPCMNPEFPGWPAGATAEYEIEGLSNVEAITLIDNQLTSVGYRAVWGPYCVHKTAALSAVYEDRHGNGVLFGSPMESPAYFDPEDVWFLKVEATVDYESGQPLRPDDYHSGNVGEECVNS